MHHSLAQLPNRGEQPIQENAGTGARPTKRKGPDSNRNHGRERYIRCRLLDLNAPKHRICRLSTIKHDKFKRYEIRDRGTGRYGPDTYSPQFQTAKRISIALISEVNDSSEFHYVQYINYLSSTYLHHRLPRTTCPIPLPIETASFGHLTSFVSFPL